VAEAELIPTWVFDNKGGSQLLHLPAGAPAPKGFAFEPPKGVELVVEDNDPPPAAPFSPPMPTDDPRVAALEDRVKTLESQMKEVGEFLNAMTTPEPAAPADERAALVARAKELDIQGVDGRTSVAKLKAAIAEVEALG
jgi:hypothetical protein